MVKFLIVCDRFDWHDGEPNDFGHNENCLALREYHDPFFPIFRDYFWNDMNCDSAHHYICENRCAEFWFYIVSSDICNKECS